MQKKKIYFVHWSVRAARKRYLAQFQYLCGWILGLLKSTKENEKECNIMRIERKYTKKEKRK